jgi:uncharacterized repeat protein (TIGR03803 family)
MSRTLFQEVTAMPAPSAHIRFQVKTGSLRVALTLLLLVVAMAATSSAQTFKTVHNFCSKKNPAGYCLDGQNPWSTLVQGANGDLYGTTFAGGANNGNYGTVFKITPAGKLITIYNLCSQPSCADGMSPQGGLLLASDGSFYGVTNQGGAYGYGTVFKITAAGKLTTLHSFNQTDGAYPQAALIQATNGNFYGTTYVGGTYSAGTAFEITPGGTFASLYSFCDNVSCFTGFNPNGLIQAADGNFYGTNYGGGTPGGCAPLSGGGTAFQLSSSGTLTTLVPIFCQPNGFYPNSALVQTSSGNFYGTTASGGQGTNDGYGTVYEMAPTGSSTSLYSFCLQTGCPDGNDPQSLILGTDGNFYGTTAYGGANNGTGTIFEITPTGQLTTLHTFAGTDGIDPFGTLLLDTNGTFYGTTYEGGTNGGGVIYTLATGLGAFVETIPTSGAAKTKVTILGTNLTGATAVRFNGTAATFKVVSASEIKTTVPAGATSGTLTVTTSGGATLNSYVAFQVP